MDTGGRECNDSISLSDPVPSEDPLLLYDSHREARKIILILGIEARHLSSLPSDEGASCLNTAIGNAFDDISDTLRDVASACDVIQKEKRLRAKAYDIIHILVGTADIP